MEFEEMLIFNYSQLKHVKKKDNEQRINSCVLFADSGGIP